MNGCKLVEYSGPEYSIGHARSNPNVLFTHECVRVREVPARLQLPVRPWGILNFAFTRHCSSIRTVELRQTSKTTAAIASKRELQFCMRCNSIIQTFVPLRDSPLTTFTKRRFFIPYFETTSLANSHVHCPRPRKYPIPQSWRIFGVHSCFHSGYFSPFRTITYLVTVFIDIDKKNRLNCAGHHSKH